MYDDLILEHLTIHQRILQLANTDVFFAVHGTGLANMLFMTRDSYLIEAYPPKWYWSCYQRFAKACGVKRGYERVFYSEALKVCNKRFRTLRYEFV